MRNFVFVILLSFMADIAIARPDVRKLSCAQAQALVQRSGAVVVTTGQHTYERYVSDQRFCDIPFIIGRAWTATADTKQCQIGYICEQRDRLMAGRD